MNKKSYVQVFVWKHGFISPNSPTRGREQKQEELQPYNLEKEDLKHSKLDKKKRQRHIVQIKQKDKKPYDQINKEEIGKLPEEEFRVICKDDPKS